MQRAVSSLKTRGDNRTSSCNAGCCEADLKPASISLKRTAVAPGCAYASRHQENSESERANYGFARTDRPFPIALFQQIRQRQCPVKGLSLTDRGHSLRSAALVPHPTFTN